MDISPLWRKSFYFSVLHATDVVAMTSVQDSDTWQEKTYLLLGAVFLLVAVIPFAGAVLSVLGIGAMFITVAVIPFAGDVFVVLGAVFWYRAFTGYSEKIGFEKPLHYFKPFIVSSAVAIPFITVFIIEEITYSNLLPQNVLAYVVIAAVAVGAYYYAHILESFGNRFDIDEFRTAKLLTYVTVYGLPLWLFLSMPLFCSIGAFILIGLAIAFTVYLFMGISKIPTGESSGG